MVRAADSTGSDADIQNRPAKMSRISIYLSGSAGEGRIKLATVERNMALDISYFVIQSYPYSARGWKAKIVHENNDSELDPTSGGASSAASLTQKG